jgi:hypothetical protein
MDGMTFSQCCAMEAQQAEDLAELQYMKLEAISEGNAERIASLTEMSAEALKLIQCMNCGEMGHMGRKCTVKPMTDKYREFLDRKRQEREAARPAQRSQPHNPGRGRGRGRGNR